MEDKKNRKIAEIFTSLKSVRYSFKKFAKDQGIDEKTLLKAFNDKFDEEADGESDDPETAELLKALLEIFNSNRLMSLAT